MFIHLYMYCLFPVVFHINISVFPIENFLSIYILYLILTIGILNNASMVRRWIILGHLHSQVLTTTSYRCLYYWPQQTIRINYSNGFWEEVDKNYKNNSSSCKCSLLTVTVTIRTFPVYVVCIPDFRSLYIYSRLYKVIYNMLYFVLNVKL